MNREAAFGISGDGRRADAGGTGEEERIGRFVERRNRNGGLGRRRRRRGVVEMGGGRGGAGAHKTRGVVVGPRVVMGRETRHNGKMGEDEQRCGEAQCRVGLSWFVLASHDPVPPRLAELTAGTRPVSSDRNGPSRTNIPRSPLDSSPKSFGNASLGFRPHYGADRARPPPRFPPVQNRLPERGRMCYPFFTPRQGDWFWSAFGRTLRV